MINCYEEHRSGENSFFLEKNGDLAFPPHFHQNIEIAIILSGSQPITVNGEFFIAKAGSVVVVDNFAVHSYGECKSKENYLLILPNGALGEFNRLRNGKVFKTPYVCNMKFVWHTYCSIFFLICKYIFSFLYTLRKMLFRENKFSFIKHLEKT